MTFSCGNHILETDTCRLLKRRCVMGRPGCVLEGKVKLSEEALKLLDEAQEETAAGRRRRNAGKKR